MHLLCYLCQDIELMHLGSHALLHLSPIRYVLLKLPSMLYLVYSRRPYLGFSMAIFLIAGSRAPSSSSSQQQMMQSYPRDHIESILVRSFYGTLAVSMNQLQSSLVESTIASMSMLSMLGQSAAMHSLKSSLGIS